MKIIRFILFALIAVPFFAAGEQLRVVDLKPTHTNSPERFGPEWEYDGIKISVVFNCYSDEGFLWWPEVNCIDPYLRVSGLSIEAGNFREVYVKAGDIRLDAEKSSLEGSTTMGVKIYNQIAVMSDPVVYLKATRWGGYGVDGVYDQGVDEVNVRLVDFEGRVEDYMSARENAEHEDLGDDIKYWVLSAIALIFGVPMAIFASWRLTRLFVPAVVWFKAGFFEVVKRIRRGVFDLKVRQATVDEAVRQVTRQKISEAGVPDKELLIGRMQEALERGDIDAAKEISLILKGSFREKNH